MKDTEDEKIANARKTFKGFDVVFREMKGENPMQILELKNPDGSKIYYTRYVFDANGGTITISGDLGYAVLRPTWRADLQSTAGIGINADYFMEKCACSTDKYHYDKKEFRERLLDWMKGQAEAHNTVCEYDFDRIDKDEIEADADMIMGGFSWSDGIGAYEDVAMHMLKKYGSDWRSEVFSWGWGWDNRVYLWLCGMEYAMEALKKEGKV